MLQEVIQSHPYVVYAFIGLFSLSVGSFLNVLVYRLPKMLQVNWTTECLSLLELPPQKEERINLFFPRSFCPSCQVNIPFWHNIPLLSYLILRGRCFNCQESIPLRYPFVEALTLVLSCFAVWHFGLTIELIFALIFVWFLLAIAIIDLQHQIIPDSLSLSLLWIGLIVNTQAVFIPLENAVLSAAGAYISLWSFIQLFYLITGKVGMGNGDFKLFAAFGAWFGWLELPFILFISSIVGAVSGIVYLKCTKQGNQTPIPFGPFLCLAGLISLFFGKDIIRVYLSFYL